MMRIGLHRWWIISMIVCLLSQELCAQTAQTGQAYRLPVGSRGNTIELQVENGAELSVEGITVRALDVPKWIQLTPSEQVVTILKGNTTQTLQFSFTVDRTAPMDKETMLAFTLTSSDGQMWNKEITIVAAAPERFELLQNYPNPFNPSTTIAYTLPRSAHVRLKVFNVLGEEVAELVNGEIVAGFHEALWQADALPSGVYFYRLQARQIDGGQARPTGGEGLSTYAETRKFILMK